MYNMFSYFIIYLINCLLKSSLRKGLKKYFALLSASSLNIAFTLCWKSYIYPYLSFELGLTQHESTYDKLMGQCTNPPIPKLGWIQTTCDLWPVGQYVLLGMQGTELNA